MYKRPLFPWQYAPITLQDLNFTLAIQNWKKSHNYVGFFMAKNEKDTIINSVDQIHSVGGWLKYLNFDCLCLCLFDFMFLKNSSWSNSKIGFV